MGCTHWELYNTKHKRRGILHEKTIFRKLKKHNMCKLRVEGNNVVITRSDELLVQMLHHKKLAMSEADSTDDSMYD